tara:strand:- start:102 stop:527 length:426 start_codon:yes stop_codon:yes gene_type:complete
MKYFYHLPQEILRKIYQYDDTYKHLFQKCISSGIKKIWKKADDSIFVKSVPVDDHDYYTAYQTESQRALKWYNRPTYKIIEHRDRYNKHPTTILANFDYTRLPADVPENEQWKFNLSYGYNWRTSSIYYLKNREIIERYNL